MGTYLSLTLKDRTEENINTMNKIWNDGNPGYEDTFHLNKETGIPMESFKAAIQFRTGKPLLKSRDLPFQQED